MNTRSTVDFTAHASRGTPRCSRGVIMGFVYAEPIRDGALSVRNIHPKTHEVVANVLISLHFVYL